MAEPIKFYAKHNTRAILAIPAIREGETDENRHGIAEIAEIAGVVSKSQNIEKLNTEPTLTESERQSIANWVRSLGGSEAEILEETAAVKNNAPIRTPRLFFWIIQMG